MHVCIIKFVPNLTFTGAQYDHEEYTLLRDQP